MRRGGWAIGGVLVVWSGVAAAQDFGGFYNDRTAPVPGSTATASTTGAPPEAAPTTPPEPPEPPPPPEPPALRFGARGTVLLTTATAAGAGGAVYTNSRAWSAGGEIDPELDVFVLRNFAIGLSSSIGGSVGRGYGADGSLIESRTTFVYVGPRFGVAIPLGDWATFFPSVAFGLEWRHRTSEIVEGTTLSVPLPIASPETTQTGFWFELFAPLLFHPRPHVVLGVGPSLFHEFARATGGPDVGGERTTVGGRVLVGGAWGADLPSAPWSHFADRNHLLLSTSAGASWTGYGGTDASMASVSVSPGADYVVGYRITLGGYVDGIYSFTKGTDPVTGAAVTRKVVGGGGGVRVGYDLRLTNGLSLFPMVGFGLEYASHDAQEGTERNKYGTLSLAVSGRLPLVAHIVPHLSVGIGPYVYRDLAQLFTPAQAGSPSVLGTSFGLSTYVFVWL